MGRRIPPRALNWLEQFAQTHGRALIYSEQIMENGKYTVRQAVAAIGPPEFRDEMAQRMSRGEALL